MNKIDKELEKLSAYIDGELSDNEKAILKEKLLSSPVLREKYNAFSQVSNAVSSLNHLPEDELLESRVMERIEKNADKSFAGSFFKKPAFAFGAMAVIMMFVFKFGYQPFNEIIDQQKVALVDFYTKNLYPLFTASSLSNDEVLNFAFARVLPLDNKNETVMSLVYDDDGSASIEIKKSNQTTKMKFDDFVEKLNLNAKEKETLNKILEEYSKRISDLVLINDQNAVVVNQEILMLNLALRAEILSFTSTLANAIDVPGTPQHIPAAVVNNIKNYKNSFKPENGGAYWLISPDTAFLANLVIDLDSIRFSASKAAAPQVYNWRSVASPAQVVSVGNNFVKSYSDSSKSKKYRVYINPGECKIEMPDFDSWTNITVKPFNFDSLEKKMDLALRKLGNLNFQLDVDTLNNGKVFSYRFEGHLPGHNRVVSPDSLPGFNFGFTMPSPDSLISSFRLHFNDSAISSGILEGLQQFNMTGLDSTFILHFGDSIKIQIPQMEAEMNKFKAEMDRLKTEMDAMRKKLLESNPSIPKKKKDPVEI